MSGPFEDAICRSGLLPNGAWDYSIDGETDIERRVRHAEAVKLCEQCPSKDACQRLHDRFAGLGYGNQAGVWAGKVWLDLTELHRPAPKGYDPEQMTLEETA